MTGGMYIPSKCIITLTKTLWGPLNIGAGEFYPEVTNLPPQHCSECPSRKPVPLGLVDVHKTMALILIPAAPCKDGGPHFPLHLPNV